jgi:SulP family sulfate permease
VPIPAHVPLVVSTRGGAIENVHYGSIAVVDRDDSTHDAIGDVKAVVFDLTEVSHLGVTAALAVENAGEEAIEKGREVFVVGATGTTQRRLEKLGLFKKLPAERTSLSRRDALQKAVDSLA